MATSGKPALGPLQQAVTVIDRLEARIADLEAARVEPIAIVGMSCRFPGGAEDPERFWQTLRDGVDAIAEVPPSRWDAAAFWDPDPSAPGKMNTRYGGFLRDVETFDPLFFGISPRETPSLDPQHRLLLEVAWEALENAGLMPRRLAGSATGVFIGTSQNDYFLRKMRAGSDAEIEAYDGTGNGFCFGSGRLSYLLGLQGPNLAVDTACSSSLVAIHLACQSLRLGECALALAGGVHLILTPQPSISLAKTQALSPDGRCKTFAAAADGYGRGEGCGLLVLKRLSDARRDGDRVLALVRGSAINHDGPSSGLTVPNGPAQQKLLVRALESAGLEPRQVGYIEAHGTGTPLGDPIEAEAVAAVYGQGRTAEEPLLIGSVKTNFGHLEAAAGVAGLIKAVLAIEHGEIPPHLHFDAPSPHIDWRRLPLRVPTAITPWPAGEKRIAGVSSFGMSGTNVHILLEEPPESPVTAPGTGDPSHLLTLSAHTEAALGDLAVRTAEHFASHPELELADFCFSCNSVRTGFAHRLGVLASSSSEAQEKLRAWNADADDVFTGVAEEPPKIAFLFSGQGSQLLGMGYELYRSEEVVRRVLDRCDALLRPELEVPLLTVLDPASEKSRLVDETAYAQPALFAVEMALAELWTSWGVVPDVLLGHSVGELAAACFAGVFSLEDGLRLVAARGRLMQQLPKNGAMLAVTATAERVEAAIAPCLDKVAIAALNGPRAVVISGERQAVEAVGRELAADGARVEALRVSHAFHSPLLEPMLDELAAVAREIDYLPPRRTLISNLSGRPIDREISAGYWVDHARRPVRFRDGVAALAARGVGALVEVGPGTALLGLARRCLEPDGAASSSQGAPIFIPSLRRGRSERRQMLSGLGRLFAHGAEVDPAGPYRLEPRRRLALPAYPFQRQRFWHDASPRSVRPEARRSGDDGCSLLGRKVRSPLLRETLFESYLDAAERPLLRDHLVYDRMVVSGPTRLGMILEAALDTFGGDGCTVEDVVFPRALVVPEDGAAKLQLVISPTDDGDASAQLIVLDATGRDRDAWVVTASATVKPSAQLASPAPVSLDEIRGRCRPTAVSTLYASLAERRIELGPTYRWLTELHQGDGEALCRLTAPEGVDWSRDPLHPGLVDSFFQPIAAVVAGEGGETFLPFHVERCRLLRRPDGVSPLWCHARLRDRDRDATLGADLRILDEDGHILVEIQGFEVRRASLEAVESALEQRRLDDCYQLVWEAQPAPAVSVTPGGGGHRWLIFSDRDGVGERLGSTLRALGHGVVLVASGDAWERLDADRYRVDPRRGDQVRTLLAEAFPDHDATAVIDLRSLDTVGDDTVGDDRDPQARVENVCSGALHLVQALADLGWEALPRLYLVTSGACSAEPEGTTIHGVVQAALWGLGATVAIEHPAMACTLVDIDDAVDALAGELVSAGPENRVVLRRGARHIARLEPLARTAPRQLTIDGDGAYLITGGLGSLGREVARWLVAEGASHLILVARSDPDEAGRTLLEELRAAEVEVWTRRVDVAREDEVTALFAEIASSSPLRGIVHAAGVLDDGVLSSQTPERFHGVLAPKVAGTWNLHRASSGLELDFFVAFSSMAAVIGAAGQGSYAAANAFMDALMLHRRALGLPGQTINWGPWASSAMVGALGEHDRRRWSDFGVEGLETAQGLGILGQLLLRDPPQAGVTRVDWRRFLAGSASQSGSPLFARMSREGGDEPTADMADSGLLRSLEGASPQEIERRLTSEVHKEAVRVLDLRPPHTLAPGQAFFELGMDSLMALELRNRLQNLLGRPLASNLVFDYPTVTSLARHLRSEVTSGVTDEPAADEAPRAMVEAEPLPAAEDIPDSELERRLLQKLNAIEIGDE